MIPKDCKRLAEVDFPVAEVSRHAAREKSIRHGHPSTLHLWWARRPLASSRAVLLALLWPDPCDPLCPPAFKAEARKRLREVPACNPGTTDDELRHALLRFIADFANWDNAAQRTYLEVSRALVKAAHAPVTARVPLNPDRPVQRHRRAPRHLPQRHPVAQMHPSDLGQHAHVDHSLFSRSFFERASQSRGSDLDENYLLKWVNSGWPSTDFTVTVSADAGSALEGELQQILQELGLGEAVRLE
jgi:hypothetical protein